MKKNKQIPFSGSLSDDCAIDKYGGLWAWVLNDRGQLGGSSFEYCTSTPAKIILKDFQ